MTNITKEQVLKALAKVEDPDLKKDLVSLGMVKNLKIDGNRIDCTIELTTPACPLKEVIKSRCEEAIYADLGSHVQLSIFMTANVTTARSNTPLLPQVKNIIAISSGKGGVGKSTVTSNLAVALASTGARVGVIDADIFGPSIPAMFNCEHEQPNIIERGGKNLIVPIEQYNVKLISIGFLTPPDNAVVWRGPMASSALKQFIGDTAWGELDYLLIDLPPGTSDIHLTLVQTVSVTGALIVTTPQKVALVDAQKAYAMFRQPQINVPVLGIIENMSYFTPEELPDSRYYLFGKGGGRQLAEKNKVPFIGEVPLVQSIRESGDNGYPAVMKDDITAQSFNAIAREVARQVAIRNAAPQKTKIVEVNA